MFFKFFDATEAKEAGRSLAAFFAERSPLDPQSAKRHSKARQQDALNKTFQKLELYKRQNPLNFYKKSQLGNSFKWALLDAGYDADFVDELTLQLMLKLR